MHHILAKKREVTYRVEKEKIETWSLIEKKKRVITVSSQTIETIAVHYVSIWIVLSLYGQETRNGQLTEEISKQNWLSLIEENSDWLGSSRARRLANFERERGQSIEL